MKLTDPDLEQMFKEHNQHSVAMACRVIYEKGFSDGQDEFMADIIGGDDPGLGGPAPDQLVMSSHVQALMHAAVKAEAVAGPHDNWGG